MEDPKHAIGSRSQHEKEATVTINLKKSLYNRSLVGGQDEGNETGGLSDLEDRPKAR